MTAYETCPECNAGLVGGQTICSSCGWDATTAVIRPPRRSPLRWLAGGLGRLVLYGVIAAIPVMGFLRLRATGPGPDLPTTLRWMVVGDGGRAEELVTIHRAHEIAGAAARFAVEQLASPTFEGDWADTLAPYATMNVRGWMPLLFYGATTGMAPASVQVFYEVRSTDGWGRPYRIATRDLHRDDDWSQDEQLAADLAAGLQSSFFTASPPELDRDRDWQRLEITSAGADGRLDTDDDLRLVSYFPVGFTLRLTQRQAELNRELERAYLLGRHHFRLEGNSWDLIDARLLAEFRLEFLP
jgi:hypothetical protein